jgi:hypothetical protein
LDFPKGACPTAHQRGCPVKPTTPQGPDQVNVLLLLGQDGPDVCDSDHSDHGEDWSYADMDTPDVLRPDRKPNNGGPQQLSAAQVLALRAAAQRSSGSTETTTQTHRGCWLQLWSPIQASSRLLAQLNSDDEPAGVPKDQKKRKAPAKRGKRRAGGQVQMGAEGKRIRVRRSVALLISPPVRRFVKGSTTDRLSLQGARHSRDSGWLKLGFGPNRALRSGFRCSHPPLGGPITQIYYCHFQY